MSWLRFFHRRRSDAELQDEIDVFLNEEASANEARGMSPEEARRQARVKFGDADKIREALWAQNSPPLLPGIARDLKYAFRTLRRTPGFSLIAVSVMALCMGAAISFHGGALGIAETLAIQGSERLVVVYEHRRGVGEKPGSVSYTPVAAPDFYEWRSKTHGFEDMAIIRYASYNLTGEHNQLPESLRAAAASWNLFPLLGVTPALGRTFIEAEDRPGNAAVMLTWSVFNRRFAGDASIVGHQVHLDGRPYTVVGVLPSWFTYPDAGIQLWVPYKADASPELLRHNDWHQSTVIARLRPDVSLANALAQVGSVQYQLHLQDLHAPVSEEVTPRSLNEDLAGNVKRPLLLMTGAVGCMLLIGCLNVSNLLVARGASRQKEVAIRSALGAKRAVLIRGQLTESVLICVLGGMSGILLSIAATRLLTQAWKDLPSAQGIYIDGPVIAFACLLMFGAALFAGVLPALTTTDRTRMQTLQSSTRTGSGSLSRTALRKALLTVEIGVTVVLLVSAGLLLKSFLRLRSADVGCVTQNMLTLDYALPNKSYDTPEKVNAFNESLLQRVKAIPGVRSAALGNTLPGAGYWGDFVFTVKEHPPVESEKNLPEAVARWTDPGYFTTLGIPLIKGRFFTGDERGERAHKVIVNRELVRRYFGEEDPIGRHLRVPAHFLPDAPNDFDYEIVGVVGDTLYQVGKVRPALYFPLFGGDLTYAMLAVHTTSDPLPFAVPVQKQIASLDPGLPVSHVASMEQMIDASLVDASLSARLVLLFAILSLLLASVGLYGVLSYLAMQRTTELGIRMALGAQREELLRLMLADGLQPVLFGLGLGLAVSFVVTRIMESMLFGARPLDPVVFSGVIATLLAVAILACLAPAWRASRLDPMQALRSE